MQSTILYFSIWNFHRQAFSALAEKYGKRFDFQEVGNTVSFTQPSDLLTYLESHKNSLQGLYVVVDYLSFYAPGSDYEKSADLIRKAILGYPEVFFLFDERIVKKNNKNLSYTAFLFTKNSQFSGCLNEPFHQFEITNDEKDLFAALRNRRSNLFDGSNLRYCVKQCYYDEMHAVPNFRRIQQSRRKHLVLCVEEEVAQNRFNSYALYTNGFRVHPVMTAQELLYVNEQYNPNDFHKIDLLVRDFDIQFSDADPEDEQLRMIVSSVITKLNNNQINLVDCIRGAKHCDSEGKWLSLDIDENHFWYKFKDVPRLFVSKGVDHIDIITEASSYQKVRPEKSDRKSLFQDDKEKQYLRGMLKPVTGIYYSFHKYRMIRNRYFADVDWSSKKLKQYSGYFIDTKRREHQHGVPLDIYHLTKSMIDRAIAYQKEDCHVLAAVVSQEVIEVLNGFHESMMLKAYKVFAESENSISMELLGGDEQLLMRDSYFRIQKINADVNRILARKEEECKGFRKIAIWYKRLISERESFKLNILNQIYSNCRVFCKRKEHFSSEAVFIGAMGHINEGYTINEILGDLFDFFHKASLELVSLVGAIKRKNDYGEE